MLGEGRKPCNVVTSTRGLGLTPAVVCCPELIGVAIATALGARLSLLCVPGATSHCYLWRLAAFPGFATNPPQHLVPRASFRVCQESSSHSYSTDRFDFGQQPLTYAVPT